MSDLAPVTQTLRAGRPSAAPSVSIIMPAFNRLHFLRPAIDSVRVQSYRDWELLVADDGSDEDTKSYVRGLDDSRIRPLWLQHTGNLAMVRNVALHHARGEYVAFMDSDDLWHVSKLQLQMESLTTHPQRLWSVTGCSVIDGTGAVRGGALTVVGGWILSRLIAAEATVHVSSVLVARRLVEESGGFDEQLSACADYDLLLRMAARSEADLVDQPLTLVRRHTEHYTNEIPCLQDLARMLEKVERTGLASHISAALRWRRANCAASLAQAYARDGQRRRAVATLSSSLRYSWKDGAWRAGAFLALARALLPDSAARVIRNYRNRGRIPAERSLQ